MRRIGSVIVVVAVLGACNGLTGASRLSVGATDDAGAPDSGDAPVEIIEAGPDGELPAECHDGQVTCVGLVASHCVDSKWQSETCPEVCIAGLCSPYLSCRNASGAGCGSTTTSCCATSTVPAGNVLRRNDTNLAATVSAFELDRYEVTVGRFRAFVAAGGATQVTPPAPGTGAHPKIAGSGWSAAWNLRLPADIVALKNTLAGGNATWTDPAGTSEHRPINRVSWLVAFAFCSWDGGRLPTLAEWDLAASAGEQRIYPWSVPATSTTIAAAYAAYDCNFTAPSQMCGTGGCSGCDSNLDIAPVGMLSLGAGKFGHLDLAGNLAEFVLDANNAPPVPCLDCAALVDATKPDDNIYVLGGAWSSSSDQLKITTFFNHKTSETRDDVGIRCARDR